MVKTIEISLNLLLVFLEVFFQGFFGGLIFKVLDPSDEDLGFSADWAGRCRGCCEGMGLKRAEAIG